MKILVYGAGMIGTTIAAHLARSGHDVTVVARGERLARIRANGLRVRQQGRVRIDRVAVDARADAGHASYDWVFVTVRAHQLAPVLRDLAAGPKGHVMVMTNHAGELDFTNALGAARPALGFPGISAFFDGDVLDYRIAPRLVQPTTLGEIDGRPSARLNHLGAELSKAGIPTAIEADIHAWLRYHAAWISVLSMMGAAAGRSTERLKADASLRRQAVDAVHEAFAVVEALGHRITPAALRLITWTPRGLLAALLTLLATDATARKLFEQPTEGMKREAVHLVSQMRTLSRSAGVPMPSYDALALHLEPS